MSHAAIVLFVIAAANKPILIEPHEFTFSTTIIQPQSKVDAEFREWEKRLVAKYKGKRVKLIGTLKHESGDGMIMAGQLCPGPVLLTFSSKQTVTIEMRDKLFVAEGIASVGIPRRSTRFQSERATLGISDVILSQPAGDLDFEAARGGSITLKGKFVELLPPPPPPRQSKGDRIVSSVGRSFIIEDASGRRFRIAPVRAFDSTKLTAGQAIEATGVGSLDETGLIGVSKASVKTK